MSLDHPVVQPTDICARTVQPVNTELEDAQLVPLQGPNFPMVRIALAAWASAAVICVQMLDPKMFMAIMAARAASAARAAGLPCPCSVSTVLRRMHTRAC